ncbi:MAG TPA: hypothetical protein VGZ47_16145 [Gemmataceae bacterium]|nr:hypothetical protein [Gemmataceae bacterium]
MRRIRCGLAVLMAAGVLLGISNSRSAADEVIVSRNSAPTKSEAEIQRLVDQMGSKRFKDREDATHELSLLGKAALPSLKQAALSPDAEVRRRAQHLVERMEPPVRPNESDFKKPTRVKSYL